MKPRLPLILAAVLFSSYSHIGHAATSIQYAWGSNTGSQYFWQVEQAMNWRNMDASQFVLPEGQTMADVWGPTHNNIMVIGNVPGVTIPSNGDKLNSTGALGPIGIGGLTINSSIVTALHTSSATAASKVLNLNAAEGLADATRNGKCVLDIQTNFSIGETNSGNRWFDQVNVNTDFYMLIPAFGRRQNHYDRRSQSRRGWRLGQKQECCRDPIRDSRPCRELESLRRHSS